MEYVFGIEVVVGMILLRLILPFALMIALCYSMHCLEVRWHREEWGK